MATTTFPFRFINTIKCYFSERDKVPVDLHQIDLSIPFTFKLENKVLFLLELSFLSYAIQPNIYIALSFIGKEGDFWILSISPGNCH